MHNLVLCILFMPDTYIQRCRHGQCIHDHRKTLWALTLKATEKCTAAKLIVLTINKPSFIPV